ncbi:DNA cytosine methyltransferase [Marinobacter nauticus]
MSSGSVNSGILKLWLKSQLNFSIIKVGYCVPRPIAVDLFAGAGGMSLGFEQAGYDVVAAVEIDPVHAATHERNFPNCEVICRSVSDLSGEDIRALAGIGNANVDVVFGGAPCQGFSMIGQRALDDPRNQLVNEFVRIVVELQADYFVFENVKGITVGKHKRFLSELVDSFQAQGYDVVTPWQVLNASEYGVPQNRERLFLMGCRQQLRRPVYPHPRNRRVGEPDNLLGLPLPISAHEALSDLPDADSFDELLEVDYVEAALGAPTGYSTFIRGIDRREDDFSYRRNFNHNLLTSSLRTVHTQASVERFDQTEPGKVEPKSRFFKLHPERPSNTLRAGTDSARGAYTSPRPIHYRYPRCITVREMARLHGFPDWFRFHVTKWHGARQVGNAVPPPLAREVARSVIEAAGIEPELPCLALNLGDDQLLTMDMSTASRYFRIDVPIAQRIRKKVEEPA